MSRTIRARASRVLLAGAVATAIAATAITPAQAAVSSVDDVTLTWAVSAEAGAGAYAGGCNFLVAGASGNAGGSAAWTPEQAATLYKATEGNVTVVKDAVGGGTVTPTWDTKCIGASGTAVTPMAGTVTNNKVILSAGTGTVDVEAGTASVSWDGAFTVVFYGGMTYWTATNPVLTVNADGTGTLTATGGGYGASMDNPGDWTALTPTQITLANLTGVSVSESGISVTPEYLGVTVDGPGITQSRTGDVWGSFPQDFVEFHSLTGQTSYWYSSGGGADVRKVAAPIDIAWEVAEDSEPPAEGESTDVDVEVTVPEVDVEPEPGVLEVSVSGTANLGEATVSSSGFVGTGSLPQVTVKDTRDVPGWSVNGRIGDFSSAGGGTIGAAAFGWTPTSTSDDVQLGAANHPHRPGLVTSSLLAQGGAGTHVLSADVRLHAPADTPAGNYTAKLTLTVIS